MKQISLLVVLFLVTAASFAQESARSLLPQSWLEGVNVTTGKPVGNMVGKGSIVCVAPLSVTYGGGTSPTTITFRQSPDNMRANYSYGWFANGEVQNLLHEAVAHHWWLQFVCKKTGESINPLDSAISVSLLPYQFESTNLKQKLEKEDRAWSQKGFTFTPVEGKDTVTQLNWVMMLAFDEGKAIIVTTDNYNFPKKSGQFDYLYINDVPLRSVRFLKFITTLQAATYITYNKRTREIIKMRLDPEWNKTVILK